MRYLLLAFLCFLFSCQPSNNENIQNSAVIPGLDISTDTIPNGGTLKFKGFLIFRPSLSSPEQSKSIINGWQLRFDSANYIDASNLKYELLTPTEVRGDTAYGEFMVHYPDTDTLPAFFEHPWTVSLNVSFKTETEHSVDTTYTQGLIVLVKK